jgi:hypothetical protein
MGKYGTNLEGFGAFEGGVNADKGAPLLSTSSDGATALLFGPAALREIQSGVANGDFAVRPDAAGDNITEENPLPYWAATPASGITIKTIDATDLFLSTGSGVSLAFVVAANTPLDREASISRYVPIASTYNRAHSYYPEVMVASGTSSDIGIQVTIGWYRQDLSFISNGPSRLTTTIAPGLVTPSGPNINQAAPDDAAFAFFKITVIVTGAGGSGGTVKNIVISEIRLSRGDSTLLVSEQTSPSTYAPSLIQQLSGVLTITPAVSAEIATDTAVDGDLAVTGDIGLDGALQFDSSFTGSTLILAGTNGRLFSFSNSAGAADVVASASTSRSGVLITKPTAGQPTTNINGTGTTDAFADALRNGGIAVDTTNNRGYFYANGWKYANLTTPSDSRLKEEITEISGALDTLRQLVPVAFKWKAPEAHGRTDCVADDGKRLGFIADQVATTDLAHWVETLGVDDREAHLVDTTEVLAVNIPQNEMEALLVQALLDIDTRLKALESR